MASRHADRSIDGFSIFGLIVVLLVMIPVLKPMRIPLGQTLTRILRRTAIKLRLIDIPTPHEPDPPISDLSTQASDSWSLPLNLTTSPALGVLILLITTTIDGSVIRTGIVGEGDSKPYDVLVLFISLAYIATALDSTGVLRSLAFYVSNQSNGSGPQLYLILYCFFFIFGVIFGNDPIILSGTAFLTYFLKNCGIINPTAWIFMEFLASNIASAVLVSSNPTNVLVAQAFDLNFLTGFTKYTILPSLAAAIVGYILLYSVFRSLTVPDTHPNLSPTITHEETQAISSSIISFKKLVKLIKKPFALIPRANYIPDRLNQPRVSPRSVLSDPQAAYFHGTLMILTLLVLFGTTFVKNVSVWEITLPAGFLALFRDLIYDLVYSKVTFESSSLSNSLQMNEIQAKVEEGVVMPVDKVDNQMSLKTNGVVECHNEQSVRNEAYQKQNQSDGVVIKDELTKVNSIIPKETSNLNLSRRSTLTSFFKYVNQRVPITSRTIEKLPLPLLPFAISMFILIASLGSLGWVKVFAKWFLKICSNPVSTVYFIGFLGSLIFCPFLGTNIGATILLVEIINHEEFKSNPKIISEPKILKSAIYSISMSSNIGAFSLTLPSSLAGLLWYEILIQKGILIKKREFFGWNLVPVLVLGFVAYSIVLIEVLYIF
ncbi:uncharacterized protein MELLADRAFT_90822 [Melampsora larici-populina 98AG31]|uniref:Citrate transporter-like domain-containing protein n=1 Tax=Melampsora larici-populina (strain 98AG31 / pathotype 3-4-7) TaxID=747676 RepID=F4R7M5_MELLP|nr:uncharacterized protein MELLADRAFT_90822 [Melampsora larici-populina 98AG31]EGG11341.1 hypothetical protein MELLADRAFT_90822 [Melampsora larici-populina 98AG31]